MFAVVAIIFYDWRECEMSVLGPQNIPGAIVLTLGTKVVLGIVLFSDGIITVLLSACACVRV